MSHTRMIIPPFLVSKSLYCVLKSTRCLLLVESRKKSHHYWIGTIGGLSLGTIGGPLGTTRGLDTIVGLSLGTIGGLYLGTIGGPLGTTRELFGY